MIKTTKLAPAAPISWTSVAPVASPARAAFASLGRADRQLLDAALFDGHGCTELACSLGVPAAEIRSRLGGSMLVLTAILAGEPCEGGAVAAMLALHALDALDADEAALVDAMLAHQPAMRRVHAGYCALVGELCLLVPPAEPPPYDSAGLTGAFADDAYVN